jgi:RNA polymerase sigma factor (sigma-70 family)
MAAAQATTVLRHIRELAGRDSTSRLSDPELLRRFMDSRDEGAFTALVKRHGGMVLGVCRRVLGNAHDAEDAFQATFLVLARKAHALSHSGSLPSWLYQVAYRVALKARGRAATRQKHEQATAGRSAGDPLAEITGRELLRALDEEVQALPERHRAPLVLCCLEDHTCDEAARRLGWSPRTLKRRLQEARRALGSRLARRGLTLAAALLAAGSGQGAGAGALSPRLVTATAGAALHALAGQGPAAVAPAVSTTVLRLAEEVVRATSAGRFRAAGVFLALAGLTAVTAGVLAGSGTGGPPPAPPAGNRAEHRSAANPLLLVLPAARAGGGAPAAVPPKDADKAEMTVSGRVLGKEGKPLAEAAVAVAGLSRNVGRGGDLLTEQTRVLAQGRTDADGRFRLRAPDATPGQFFNLYLLARAPGYGVGVQPLNLARQANEATLTLQPERAVRGRLVDLQGQPAAGVTVFVRWVGQSRNGEPAGVHFSNPPRDLAFWPEPVKTEGLGRFTLRGLSGLEEVHVYAQDDRFAPQSIYFGRPDLSKVINHSLTPAQTIEGAVTYADTGKPVANALVQVDSAERELGSHGAVGGRTDEQGRFCINPLSGKWFTVAAHAPEGEPYLALEKQFKWESGKIKHRVELKLPRGVLIRGKVTEAGSGRPVAQVSVQYFPQEVGNPNYHQGIRTRWEAVERSGPDGTFRVPVLPGPGHLLILGPGGDYVHQEIGSNLLFRGEPGGKRYYADAVVKLDPPKGAATKDVAVQLRRGVTVKGRLLGPDGQPLKGKALMLCNLHIDALSPFWRFPVEVRDGQFELHGVDPEKGCRVAFLEPAKAWGKAVELSGKQAAKPVTLKLEPCGRAVARFVDPAGKPVAGHRPLIDIAITPGAWRYDSEAWRKGQLLADAEHLANVDRHNYWNGPQTDADGRITFPALIPGVTYQIPTFRKGEAALGREFVAVSGKTFDAGAITFQAPP